MKKKDRSDILYLEDLLTAMNRIAEYIEGLNFELFKKDYKTVDAKNHLPENNLQIDKILKSLQ